jgi:hypothetical protein
MASVLGLVLAWVSVSESAVCRWESGKASASVLASVLV